MTSKIKYYNVDDYIKQKKQQEKGVRMPPKTNFLAAANHIQTLFDRKNFIYGIMGGFEMLCLGNQREMSDLQIAYDDKDFHRIRSKLEGDPRVRLPDGMNSLFPAKILVRTGPSFKDEGCTQAADIEVDLLPPGAYGGPPTGGLASNLVLLSLNNEGKLRAYKGLNMLYLVKTLVQYCRVPELAWDPRKDILFLCQHYSEEVQSMRNQLDQKAIQQNFLGTPYFSRLSPRDQRRCYQILLGTEPPPKMAIIPPPPLTSHKHSASTSDLTTQSHMSAHRPKPSVDAHKSSELLSLPLFGKPGTLRSQSSENMIRLSERPASTNKQTQSIAKLGAATRDSRLRYRPISSPNVLEMSPIDARNRAPEPVDMRQSYEAANLALDHLTNNKQQYLVQQLQPLAHLSPMFMGMQAARSMPSLYAGSTGAVPPYAFDQTSSLNGFPVSSQQFQTQMSSTQMSASPARFNSGQQHGKLHVRMSGGYLPQHRQASGIPNNKQPIGFGAKDSHQGQQVERAELFGTPMPEAQTNKLHITNSAGTNTMAPCPISSGGFTSSYVEPLTSGIALGNSNRTTHPSLLHGTSTTISTSPVELDTMPQLSQFIAELSADRSTPAPEHHVGHVNHQHPQVQQSSTVQSYSAPTYTDSTISSPESQYTPTTPQELHKDIPIRPLNPRTYSSTAPAMPASLMPGATNTQQRSPSNNPTQRPVITAVAMQATVPNTNASIYTDYSTPPSSTPASPQPTHVSTYKAYQPPSTSIPLSSPSYSLSSPDSATEPSSTFTALRDVDGASGYFRHRRDASEESCDSGELAMEYQAAMPEWGKGYGSHERA